MGIVARLREEMPVITKAPWSFASAVVTLSALIGGGILWIQSERFSLLEAQLQAKPPALQYPDPPKDNALATPLSARTLAEIDAYSDRLEAEWVTYKPQLVQGKTFINKEVPLDGYAYDDCVFENVNFVYNGMTKPQITNSEIRGYIISSRNLSIETTLRLLGKLGMIKFEPRQIDR